MSVQRVALSVADRLERPPAHETVMRPHGRRFTLGLRELWNFRELLYFLVWRDIKVRYKQSVVGIAWALLQPLATMTLFSLVFGRLVHLGAEGVPYPVFVLTGLVAWQAFAYVLGESTVSLVLNKELVTKVYFPRMLIPASNVMAAFVDFFLAGIVLIGFLAYYGVVPTVAVLAVPLFVMLLLISALGVGLWLSALNVLYRDIQYTIPFMTQFWFFATPIVYSASLVPAGWRWLLALNPIAGVVTGLRWAVLGTALDPFVYASVASAWLLLLSGFLYFRRVERVFADVV